MTHEPPYLWWLLFFVHFRYVSLREQLYYRKMPSFLNRLSALYFVSYHRFDYPQHLYAGRKHSCNFLVFLSGRLTDDIIWDRTKLAMLKQLPGPITFCSLRPRKKNTKASKKVFFFSAHRCCGLFEPWEDSKSSKKAESLFLETRAFFYERCERRDTFGSASQHKKATIGTVAREFYLEHRKNPASFVMRYFFCTFFSTNWRKS